MKGDRPLPKDVEEKLLGAYPVRSAVPWDTLGDRVVLAVPKRFGALDRWLQKLVPGPTVAFLSLDDVGTSAWLACDGSRTGQEVADTIRKAFGEAAEPAEARAAAFLSRLMGQGLLRAFDAPVRAEDPERGFTPEKGFEVVTCRRCDRAHPLKIEPGARYVCPGCGKLSRVTRAPG